MLSSFSLAAFNSSAMMCLGMDLFVFILWDLLLFLNLYMNIFHQMRDVLAIISSKFIPASPTLSGSPIVYVSRVLNDCY